MNSYEVYLGKLLLPVAPSKITVKTKNLNETAVMVSGKEINIPKAPGLREITLTAMLPNTKLPFARYKNNNFIAAKDYLEKLESMKKKKKPFTFKIIRFEPVSDSDNIRVLLEDYNIVEDANEGLDVMVDITLREYVDYGVKVVVSDDGKIVEKEKPREQDNAPEAVTHTVVKGDCLWDIAQKYLNDGNRYEEIYQLNKSVIEKGNANTSNHRNTIYPGQVFRIPER